MEQAYVDVVGAPRGRDVPINGDASGTACLHRAPQLSA